MLIFAGLRKQIQECLDCKMGFLTSSLCFEGVSSRKTWKTWCFQLFVQGPVGSLVPFCCLGLQSCFQRWANNGTFSAFKSM